MVWYPVQIIPTAAWKYSDLPVLNLSIYLSLVTGSIKLWSLRQSDVPLLTEWQPTLHMNRTICCNRSPVHLDGKWLSLSCMVRDLVGTNHLWSTPMHMQRLHLPYIVPWLSLLLAVHWSYFLKSQAVTSKMFFLWFWQMNFEQSGQNTSQEVCRWL